MSLRRVSKTAVLLIGMVFLLTLSPLAQPESDGGSVLAVSTYNLVNDRSQILLLSLTTDNAVSLLHEVLLPLDSGIVAYNYGLALSPDLDSILYPAIMAEGPDQLFAYDLATSRSTPLIDDRESIYSGAALSRDGAQIAFTMAPIGTDSGEIYRADTDGTARVRLAAVPDSSATGLTWSPDGTALAYIVAQDSAFQLLTLSAEGGDSRVVYRSDLPLSSVAWAPDGQRLFFVSQTADELGTAIYSVTLDGGAPRTEYDPAATSDFTPGLGWLTLSPDGTHLAFAASELMLSKTGTMVNRATLRVLSLETGQTDILPWDFGTAFITGLDWRAPSTTD